MAKRRRSRKPELIFKDITPEEADQLIQKKGDNLNFVILDVRTLREYAQGHLVEAENLDFYESDFEDELNKLSREKTYLVYCRTGKRSNKALEMMKELGFYQVYNLIGGIVKWKKNGYQII